VNVAHSNQADIIFQETHLGLRSLLTSTAAAIHNIHNNNNNSSNTVSRKAQGQATDYTSTVTGL
jgi:hypothetical protein